MAEKQSTKDAVKRLMEGEIDPYSQTGRDISEAVAERVLREQNSNTGQNHRASA